MVHGNWGHPRRRAKAALNTWATAGEPFPMSAGVGNNFWLRPGIVPPTSQSTGHLGCEHPVSLLVYHTGQGPAGNSPGGRGLEAAGWAVACPPGNPRPLSTQPMHTPQHDTPAVTRERN